MPEFAAAAIANAGYTITAAAATESAAFAVGAFLVENAVMLGLGSVVIGGLSSAENDSPTSHAVSRGRQ